MAKIDTKNPRLTFAQITLQVSAIKDVFARSISYSDGMERGDIEGNAQMALGVSAGMYRPEEGELELYADEFAQVQEEFKGEFYTREFDIIVTYQKEGDSKLTVDTLVGCRFTKRAVDDQTGPDALTRTASFKPTYVKFNGHNPLPDKYMPTGTK